MKPPLILQVEQARSSYLLSMSRQPRAERTSKLLWRLQELRRLQLKEEIKQEKKGLVQGTTEPASAVIGHRSAENA